MSQTKTGKRQGPLLSMLTVLRPCACAWFRRGMRRTHSAVPLVANYATSCLLEKLSHQENQYLMCKCSG